MECKKCKNRQNNGFCQKTNQFVPKKQRIDGINPASNCLSFISKGDKR